MRKFNNILRSTTGLQDLKMYKKIQVKGRLRIKILNSNLVNFDKF